MSTAEISGATPATRRTKRPAPSVSRSDVVQYLTTGMVVILVVGPILPILYQAFLDRPLYERGGALVLSNYQRLFLETEFLFAAFNSVVFATLTTILAVAAGAFVALLVTRTRVWGASFIAAAMLLPLYVSPLVLSFGWIILYGPTGYISLLVAGLTNGVPWNIYSVSGMAVAASVAYAPIAYLYCSSALKLADPSTEDAARTCGASPLRIIGHVTVPLMRPPIIYSALLIFSSALELLSIPLILGKPAGITMFATFLFDIGLSQANPDYGVLGAASTVLLAVGVALVLMQMRLLRQSQRFVTLRGKAVRRQLLDLGWFRHIAFGLTVAFLLLACIAPIAALAARSFTIALTPLISPLAVLTLDHYRLIFSEPSFVRSIWNSVFLATVGGLLTSVFALLVVLVSLRSTFRFGGALQILTLVPQALPAILIGLGFFWFFALFPPLSWVRGTLVALMIAFACRTLPMAYAAIAPMVTQIAEELDHAARSVGADWLTTITRVMGRLFTPGIFAAFVLCFVQMMKELSSAIFLVTADTQIIGTTALQLWLNGDTGSVAALSVVEVVITLGVVFIFSKLFKVRVHA